MASPPVASKLHMEGRPRRSQGGDTDEHSTAAPQPLIPLCSPRRRLA